MARSELLTVKQYEELGYEKLHRRLVSMIAESNRMVVWFNQAKQLRLLPALTAMNKLVARPGRRFVVAGQASWEDECRSLGLNPATVRQWKKRTAAEMDLGSRFLRGAVKDLEVMQDLRLTESRPRNPLEMFAEHAGGYGYSCFLCT
jgi:hypothetical protein